MSLNQAMQKISENRMLNLWASQLSRSPSQLNQHQESDAELVVLPGANHLLATSIDTVEEEIALGFYTQPETMGWMGATAALSDLAAVGAEPLGLVVSVTLPGDQADHLQYGIARGLEQACRASGTFILGGDTNLSDKPSITGCAFGLVSPGRALRRVGCSPGELVYASGPLGLGSLAAARALFELPGDFFQESDYRPVARFQDAALIADFATSCMDTSDGLVATLDQLMRLNHTGFDLTRPLNDLLHPRAQNLCRLLNLPPLVMLAGHHGEFELVFTIKAKDQNAFEGRARLRGLTPVLLGRVSATPAIRVQEQDHKVVDSARIRNLFEETGGDLRRYLAELVRMVNS